MRLETERLIIRDWSPEDAVAAFAIYGDPEVMRYVGNGKPFESLEQTKEILGRIIARTKDQPLGFWAVENKPTGELIGGALLQDLPDHSDVEVGYHLGKPWWGKGYATELSTALVRYGFDTLKLNKIVGVTYPENLPSQRVLTKSGLSHVGSSLYADIPVERFEAQKSWN